MRTPALASMLLVMLVAAAAGASEQAGSPQPPKQHDFSYTYDLFDQSVVRPATRWLDPPRIGRLATRHPREAANVDASDEVRLPSTWWQPRLGFRNVTREQMLHGPGPGTGPAPGRWTIKQAKVQGVSPGFQIVDANGDRFIIKFDLPAYAGAATGADVISSHLMWAAGYNVPDNAIAHFRLEDLDIAKGTTYVDAHGKHRPFTHDYLVRVLAMTAPPVEGRYRCIASRFIEGKPIGPFRFEGRRHDDPEDLVPHELRRELRGLWTLAAWINHSDSRDANTLDAWVTEHDRSFVRHYLIDFGSTLGSATDARRDPATGFEYYVDYGTMARETAMLGLRHARWESIEDPHLPSVGIFEAKRFDPATWRPDYPNPAFDERTARDVRWGARILAAFTDEQIRAAVEAGQLPDPGATEYVTRVLIERRDKLVRRWLGQGSTPPMVSGRATSSASAPSR